MVRSYADPTNCVQSPTGAAAVLVIRRQSPPDASCDTHRAAPPPAALSTEAGTSLASSTAYRYGISGIAIQSYPAILWYRLITTPNSPGWHTRSSVGDAAQTWFRYTAACPVGSNGQDRRRALPSDSATDARATPQCARIGSSNAATHSQNRRPPEPAQKTAPPPAWHNRSPWESSLLCSFQSRYDSSESFQSELGIEHEKPLRI